MIGYLLLAPTCANEKQRKKQQKVRENKTKQKKKFFSEGRTCPCTSSVRASSGGRRRALEDASWTWSFFPRGGDHPSRLEVMEDSESQVRNT